jgi:hypothetical protein
MSFETALAVLVRTRTDVLDVMHALCDLATIAHFLGQVEKRDQMIEVAADLAQESGPRRSGAFRSAASA